MSSTNKVVKNSLILISQTLFLNVLSIFAIGYIARILGDESYGKFTFAFSFVMLFTPLANVGLRAVTVREIVKQKDGLSEYSGNMLVLRLVLSVITVILIMISVNIIHYPVSTKIVVYWASSILIFQAVSSTFQDVFQAYEELKYVAFTQFISGFILTILSIIVLYCGYHLIGLTIVYCIGNLIAAIVATYFMINRFSFPKISINFVFWKDKLKKGYNFFYPSLAVVMGAKLGIVFLSKFAGEVNVGYFGAANNLVEKFLVIPDAICTAIFPTLVYLYKNSRDESIALFKRFFGYQFLLGLPLAVGTTLLAKPVVSLIYGNKFDKAVLVLQILIWWLFLTFLTELLSWTLGAIHKEKETAKVRVISTLCFILMNLVLIPIFKEVGVALACFFTSKILFLFLYNYTRKYLTHILIEPAMLIKILVGNFVMAVLIIFVLRINFWLSAFLGSFFYIFYVFYLKIVQVSDIRKILNNKKF